MKVGPEYTMTAADKLFEKLGYEWAEIAEEEGIYDREPDTVYIQERQLCGVHVVNEITFDMECETVVACSYEDGEMAAAFLPPAVVMAINMKVIELGWEPKVEDPRDFDGYLAMSEEQLLDALFPDGVRADHFCGACDGCSCKKEKD